MSIDNVDYITKITRRFCKINCIWLPIVKESRYIILATLLLVGCADGTDDDASTNTYPVYSNRFEVIVTPFTGFRPKLNDRGDIIGPINDQGNTASAIWTIREGMKIIDSSTEHDANNCSIVSLPVDLNNAGYVIIERGGCIEHKAYVWHETTGSQLLADISPLQGRYINAYAINNNNQIVGSSSLPAHNFDHAAYYWDMERNIVVEDFGDFIATLLPSHPAYSASSDNQWTFTPTSAIAISDTGLVAVQCSDSSLLCTWSKEEGIRYLQHQESSYFFPVDISDKGTIIGLLHEFGGITNRPFQASIDNGWSLLPNFEDGNTKGEVNAINNTEQIVGSLYTSENDTTAVLWEDGKVFDLNYLTTEHSGERFLSAIDINNIGQIIVVESGSLSVYLLSPIQN